MSSDSVFSELESAEIIYAASGRVSEITLRDPAVRANFVRAIRANFRESEKIIRRDIRSPLQLARALIPRGKLEEAAKSLELAERNTSSSAEAAERIRQRARLHTWRGDWSSVIMDCGAVLGGTDVSLLSRAAAIQIRANAWLECREYTRADQDLRAMEDLCEMLPHGQIQFYAEVSRAKLSARLVDIANGRGQFLALVEKWRARISERNLDELLTLLRLAIDLDRLEGRDTRSLAMACVWVAHAIGDETYCGLGWIDTWAGGSSEEKGNVLAYLGPILTRQPRIRALFEELRRDSAGEAKPLTDTAWSIQESWKRAHAPKKAVAIPNCADIDRLLCLDSWIQVDLKELKLVTLRVQPRMKAILRALADGALSKEELFHRVWGLARYDSARHDSIIRTAIMRTREQAQVEIVSRDGKIAIHPRYWTLLF